MAVGGPGQGNHADFERESEDNLRNRPTVPGRDPGQVASSQALHAVVPARWPHEEF
jgi:hypothetical protein